MGTALDTGTGTSGPPAAKLPNVGDSLTFAVIDIDNDVPVYKFGVEPLTVDLNLRGEPKKQTRITALAVASVGATTGGDEPEDIKPGDIVSIYIGSYAKYDPDQDKLGGTHVSWSEAIRKAGGLEVGSVGQWKFLAELPSKGAFPRKDRKFALRKAKPEEAQQTERCESERKRLKGLVLETVPAASGPFDDNLEDF
jgi:hypothetical protein